MDIFADLSLHGVLEALLLSVRIGFFHKNERLDLYLQFKK